MEQVGDMLHGSRNAVTTALGMGAVIGNAVLNKMSRSSSCPPNPVSVESALSEAPPSLPGVVTKAAAGAAAGVAAASLAPGWAVPLVGAVANAATGYVANKRAGSKATKNQEELTQCLTQAVQDTIEKVGQSVANTVSTNSYAGAYEGARDAIRDAMQGQKRKRPAPSSSSNQAAGLIVLKGAGKMVAIAVQEFLSHPSPGSLKHLVKLMHDSRSQHSWYKTFQNKLDKGELAGVWLYEFLMRKPRRRQR